MADTKEYEAFEANLKLNYEAVRKDLDIVLTSMIPMQKNLVKTYLWLNTTILGVIAAIYHTYGLLYGTLLLPFSASAYAVFISIFALVHGQDKYFGHIDINAMSKLPSDEMEKVRGLVKMTSAVKEAFEFNKTIVIKRSKYLRNALHMTIASFALLFIFSIVFINFERKEVNNPMGDNKKEEVMKDSQHPASSMSTNNTSRHISNESGNYRDKSSGFSIITEDKKSSKDTIEKKK